METYKVTKQSVLTGKFSTRAITMRFEDYVSWTNGEKLIQNAFPYMSADDREFLMTGITPEDWDMAFGEES